VGLSLDSLIEQEKKSRKKRGSRGKGRGKGRGRGGRGRGRGSVKRPKSRRIPPRGRGRGRQRVTVGGELPPRDPPPRSRAPPQNRNNGGGRRRRGVGKRSRMPPPPRRRYSPPPPAVQREESSYYRNAGKSVTTDTITVRGLRPTVTSDDIKEIFEQVGITRRAFVDYDSTGRSSGAAQVKYTTGKHAREAVRRFDGVSVDERQISVMLGTIDQTKGDVEYDDYRGGRMYEEERYDDYPRSSRPAYYR